MNARFKPGTLSSTRLYHGTRSASVIDALKPSTGGEFGPGIYLTASPDTANFYASVVAQGPDGPSIMPVYADIQNPFRVSKYDWIEMTQRSTPSAVQRRLVKKGYDGIIGVGINGIDEQIVAFRASQVRSAIGGSR